MNWTNRCAGRIFSLAALAALLSCATVARADTTVTFVFGGTTLRMSHLETVDGAQAIAVNDPGLAQLLTLIGTAMTWRPGERYVLFTTAQPQVVSFSVGDRRYDIGPLSAQASIAPYIRGNTVYVPFEELLRAFSLAQKPDGDVTVLQPQLTAVDVRAVAGGTQLLARGGVPLRPRQIAQSADRLVYEFDGIGTTLERTQSVSTPGVRALEIAQSGSARDPITTMTVDLVSGDWQTATGTDDGRDFSLTLTQSATAGGAVAQASPAAQVSAPQPAASAAASNGAQVTAVNEVPGPMGLP